MEIRGVLNSWEKVFTKSMRSSATPDSSSAILLKLRMYSATSPRAPRISTRTE